jgi:hypothetical protein
VHDDRGTASKQPERQPGQDTEVIDDGDRNQW